MSKYGDCMCKVCEQKRLAAAEVDKLKGMMVKPMSADHEKIYDPNIKLLSHKFDAAAAEEDRKAEEFEARMAELKQQQENFDKHLNHPFYKKVDAITEEVAEGQILKGAAKYPEPFNPQSWTPKQLVRHQLEELRDAQVYSVGLLELLEDQEALIESLQAKILKQDKQFMELAQENEKIKYTITENCNLRKHIEELESHIKKQGNTMGDFAITAMDRTNEIKALEEKLKFSDHEKEYWRLRALINDKPTGSKPTLIEIKTKYNGPFNGGCV